MISSIKLKLISIAEIAHLRIFGHEMSDEMRGFLKNLSWSFFGGFIAAGIMFALAIIAGRWLGPVEYGKYNLVLLIAQFFTIPMLLGMDISVLQKIVKAGDSNKRKELISSSLLFVLVLMSIVSISLFLNREFLANIFSTKVDLVFVAVVFSIALVLKMLLDGIIKGLYFFKFQAIIKIAEAIVAILIFFALHLIFKNYLQLAFSLIIAGLVVSILYAFKLKTFFGKLSTESIKKLLRYSKFVFVGSLISIIIGYGDRFVVNKYFGVEELGIYSAYYTATILVAGQFISIISNVFFAMVAKVEEKRILLKKIDKMLLVGIAPATFAMFVIGFVVLKLFGSAYKASVLVLFLFGFVATLQFFVSFYANMVNSHSEKTYFWGLSLFSIRTFFYVVYILILIKFSLISIPTILFGLVMNYVVDIFNLRYIIKKYA